MNITAQVLNNTATTGILYMALELSQSKWHLAFGNGMKIRQVVLEANDVDSLQEEIKKAKDKFRLPPEVPVISCYEAGRDGFWIHRYLEENGIKNHVIDSSSIKVDRKARRAKTDRLDAEKLLNQLINHVLEREKFKVARVPTEAEEDRRRMHRERERLKKERTGHTNRIKSLLNLHGIKCKGKKQWKTYLDEIVDWKGNLLPIFLKEELLREVDRLELIEKHVKELESKMAERLEKSEDLVFKQIEQLKKLKGIGDVSSWVLIMEWFGWRKFNNRREIGAAAGLVGTPCDSGNSQKELGISKAGNNRIRALMIELGWSWLRYQPNSDLSKWFDKRFNHSKRFRKIGIVALARRLLIAIWRYVTTGELPKGAQLKAC